jgi:hypothetical protein
MLSRCLLIEHVEHRFVSPAKQILLKKYTNYISLSRNYRTGPNTSYSLFTILDLYIYRQLWPRNSAFNLQFRAMSD